LLSVCLIRTDEMKLKLKLEMGVFVDEAEDSKVMNY
jgi:hypothetical protein